MRKPIEWRKLHSNCWISASDDTAYFDTATGFKNVMLPLYEDNASSLPRFFNKIDFEIGVTKLYITNIERVLPFTERLIAYLKKNTIYNNEYRTK